MSAIDEFQRLAFDGIAIPYQQIRVSGGLRDHVHEYPHVAGGSAEKLGRRLYTVSISTRFDQNLRNPRYSGAKGSPLYPDTLGVLLAKFEDQTTAPLVVPGLGTFPAYCTNWTRTLSSRIRSGEDVELEFREDQEAAYLILEPLKLPAARMVEMLGELEPLAETQPTVFESLRAGINGVLAYRDQGQMLRGVLIDKIESLRAVFEEADATLEELKNPNNAELVYTFQRLWASIVELRNEIANVDGTFRVYVVPRDMTASEVSLAVYGDTAHTQDVLSLNSLPDPMLVQAGTSIRYFA